MSFLLRFYKQSPLQSPFWLWQTVLLDYESCIYEWNAIQKIDITNKCSTMCVCRIVLQKFYFKIKKSNYNIDISNVSDLPFDGMCLSLEKLNWGHSAKITNNRYVSQNNLRKKRCKCFDIVLGSDGKKQGTQYRNISRCILY